MSGDLPVLDKQKALSLAAGKEKLANDLLAMLIKELPEYKRLIDMHLHANDREELRKIIHKLHGGLRYVGAPALMDIVSKTDAAVFELSETELKENTDFIYKEIDNVLSAGQYV